jgi:hypothetical protein
MKQSRYYEFPFVIAREGGQSSNHSAACETQSVRHSKAGVYWMPRLRGGMTGRELEQAE